MSLETMSPQDQCINAIRTLSMDAVQKAGCGHPGTPMALAPLAYALWHRVMKYNPKNPAWFDRDRFVLSAGHASMLQYAALHLFGYDVSLEDIKNFRQWGSNTAGHPEYHETPGVETTTGPLGQGFVTGVGMAIAEAHLAAVFNREGFPIVDHHVYAICSDGDLMEGVSHEAASLAGHLGLSKLVYFFDDNHITIEGDTDLACSDDVKGRFESYGWRVEDLKEQANDVEALVAAADRARNQHDKPSLIVIRSHIGFGAPTRQDTAQAHGEALGEEEIRGAKRSYGWPEDESFLVPEAAATHAGESIARGADSEQAWNDLLGRYREAHPELGRQLEDAIAGRLPEGWDSEIPEFPADGKVATRAASGKVLVAIAKKVPTLMGGSADLAGSTKTLIESESHSRTVPAGRNMHWGIREHGMAGCMSGMALHGGVRPYGATFFVFTDYARPSIRLASLMKLPVTYVMTHDSIGLGEDGPTHQPIEHLASLRAMPDLWVVRPADANETAAAWKLAMTRSDGPTMLVLTRQGVPTLDRSQLAAADGLLKGGYVLASEKGDAPDVILIATGSEVLLALQARETLAGEGIDARVVSLPCWEAFAAQSSEYRESVLPSSVRARVSVEAGSPFGWQAFTTDAGRVIGIDRFGASAPYQEIYEKFGITAEAVVTAAREVKG